MTITLAPAAPAPTYTTTYTVTDGTRTHYQGDDPDTAIRELAALIEVEEPATLTVTEHGINDPETAAELIAEATRDVSHWPACGYPFLLAPAEMREHTASCRECTATEG